MGQIVTIPVRSFRADFTNADLVDGVLTLNHKLGKRVVSVSIYDNNYQLVNAIPVLTSTTACTVELSLAQPLTGTWHAIVNS